MSDELSELSMWIRAAQQIDRNKFLTSIGIGVEAEAKSRAPVRRGSLRRAISHRVNADATKVDVGVLGGRAKSVPYAKIQEEGGKISKDGWLAIPLENKYRDRTPRSFDLVSRKLGGKVYLIDRSTGEAAYRLMRSVKIKATHYLSGGLEAYMRKSLDRLVQRTLDQLFKA